MSWDYSYQMIFQNIISKFRSHGKGSDRSKLSGWLAGGSRGGGKDRVNEWLLCLQVMESLSDEDIISDLGSLIRQCTGDPSLPLPSAVYRCSSACSAVLLLQV